jgi:hypothetical protein
MRKFIALSAVASLLAPVALGAQLKADNGSRPAGALGSCPLEGTGRLEEVLMNGKPQPFDKPHLKIMNATHFAVVEQLSDSVPSATDSTRKVARPGSLTRTIAGRYSLNGDDYVEHFEIFPWKQGIGSELHCKCEVIGDLWYHRFTLPGTTQGTTLRFEEHYRRISP